MLADYAHHNEEAMQVWWEEEGKHADDDNYEAEWKEDEYRDTEYEEDDEDNSWD